MVEKKRKIIKAAAVCMCALLALGICMWEKAYAASPVGAEDGVYSVPVDLSGLAMGADHFSSTAKVEKETTDYGTYYYFTFGHSSGISNLNLNLSDQRVGYTVAAEGGWTYYTYTLGERSLQSSLPFTAHINAMNSEVSFSVKLNLQGAERTGAYTYEGERPAEFVPVITTGAGSEYEVRQGTVFAIPSATAFLGAEACAVTTEVSYLINGESEAVKIEENRFLLEKVGEYRLVYRASSPRYQTSRGNDTYAEYTVTIRSRVNGSMIAKYVDRGGALPEGTEIVAGRIAEGSEYEKAAVKMKPIADRFEVFGISLITAEGDTVDAEGTIELYLQAEATYDRTKAVVYHLDEAGNLTELETSGYGRYVKVITNKTGTFIVCIPGVAFVMPMWGYAVILAGAVLIVAAAVTGAVCSVKRRKRRRASEQG